MEVLNSGAPKSVVGRPEAFSSLLAVVMVCVQWHRPTTQQCPSQLRGSTLSKIEAALVRVDFSIQRGKGQDPPHCGDKR